MDFPRFQMLLLGVVLLGIYLSVWTAPSLFAGLTITLLTLCLGFQMYKIYPYTPLSAKQVIQAEPGTPIHVSLMVANVYMENRQAFQFLEIVRNAVPDMLLAVETDQWWAEQLQPLEADYHYTVQQPLSNTYGMILYSKFPLIDPEVRYLVNKGIPSIQTQISLPAGRRIWLYGLPPRPPSPTGAQTTTGRDAESDCPPSAPIIFLSMSNSALATRLKPSKTTLNWISMIGIKSTKASRPASKNLYPVTHNNPNGYLIRLPIRALSP